LIIIIFSIIWGIWAYARKGYELTINRGKKAHKKYFRKKTNYAHAVENIPREINTEQAEDLLSSWGRGGGERVGHH
jgi:hypothetical protein